MKPSRTLLALSLVVLPLSVHAAQRSASSPPGLSYSFLDARYVTVDGDGADADGYGISASFLVHPNVFLFGGYADVESDGGIDVETTTISGGVGFRHGVSGAVDLVGSAAAVNADVDVPGFGSDDDTGFALEGGVRALLTPMFEIGGAVTYIDIFEEDETDFVASGLLHLGASGFSVGASYAVDAEALSVGGRFNF